MPGYQDAQPERQQVDATSGPLVLDFGNNWCGYCQAAQPLIAAAFGPYPEVAHLRLADAREKPLGRSFTVKLWPTLVFLRDGKEIARVVRPHDSREMATALAQITQPASQ